VSETETDRLALLDAPRVLVLDGAYGTEFRKLDLPEEAFHPAELAAPAHPLKGNYELLNLSRPEIVRDLHRDYLQAGADIIEPNTFNANPLIQADWGTGVLALDMAWAGAVIARAAADAAMKADPAWPRLVAGALGVTRRNPARKGADSPPGLIGMDDDAMAAACQASTEALIDGGVDLILIETVTSIANARLAMEAVRAAMSATGGELPIVLSATVNAQARLETGETLERLVEQVGDAGLYALGLNCALDGRALSRPLEALARLSPCRVWLYPNAGYPDEAGRYHEPPEETLRPLEALARAGLVDALGGCCGTTPPHIAALARTVRGLAPRHAR